jgi:diguanylate cyclase (GGDEF)-like protein
VTGVVAGLRTLSAAVLSAGSVEDVADGFLAAARDLVGVDQVHLVEVSQDASVGHGRVVSYEAGGRREDAYVMVLDERPSGVGTVVRTGEPLVVADARSSTALRADYTERFNVHSVVFAPIAWGGEVRWASVLARCRPEPFTDEEVERILLLADQAAAGLALIETREERSATESHGPVLTAAARALNSSLDLETVLSTLTRAAGDALGGDMAGVYLGDGVTGGVATAGYKTPPQWDGYLMRPGEGVGGQVLKTDRPVITNAYQEDVLKMPASPIAEHLRTAVAVPMRWDGALRGALSVGFSRMRRITRSDLRLLEALADMAAVACRNAEAFRAANQLDALTGTLEHGAFQTAFATALAEPEPPRGCLLIDLDGFDDVNAREGHRQGDDQLRRVAALVRRECGEGATVGRFGGDQFAAVVREEPAAAADRILAALKAELGLSASIGVARAGASAP